MKSINLKHPIRQLMLSKFKNVVPDVNHVKEIISEETNVFVNGELIAVYKRAESDLNKVRNACLKLKYNSYNRQSGLPTDTIGINASPRNGLRTNKCRFTKFHEKQTAMHAIFLSYARDIAKIYRDNFRKLYVNQVRLSYIGHKKVNGAYRIMGTPFTSGVINKNTALGYHRDTANTKEGISCMQILKKGVSGGELILPELNLGFACQDGFILLFDGQKYIHGVTPIIHPQSGKGYRFTIVYYNNKGMALCLPPAEEEAFYRNYLEKKTELHFKQNQKKNERSENNSTKKS